MNSKWVVIPESEYPPNTPTMAKRVGRHSDTGYLLVLEDKWYLYSPNFEKILESTETISEDWANKALDNWQFPKAILLDCGTDPSVTFQLNDYVYVMISAIDFVPVQAEFLLGASNFWIKINEEFFRVERAIPYRKE